MNRYGFLKVACITPKVEVGNPAFNVNETLEALKNLKSDVALFPELGITAYTCGDLFFQTSLLRETKEAIQSLLQKNTYPGIVIIGAPLDHEGVLYNVAFVIQQNRILGIVPKHYLPNTGEFYEKRWFKSGRTHEKSYVRFLGEDIPFGNILFTDRNHSFRFGIEICEDMWAVVSPGNVLSMAGANVIFNLSASNEVLGKAERRKTAIVDHSRRNVGAYVYASAGASESTSDTVFSGHNVIAEAGDLLMESEKFSTETDVIYADIDLDKINFKRRSNSTLRDMQGRFRFKGHKIDLALNDTTFDFTKPFDQTPFVPKTNIEQQFRKIASLQEYALVKRLHHINQKKIIIGISGGLDSTLALLVAAQAFDKLQWDKKGIIAVTMPGLATSSRTNKNAKALMKALGVTMFEKSIKESAKEQLALIDHDGQTQDITYENVQARLRTLVLMNLANMHGGIVLGTGDMSELALGWCTYNGDQMSMYGINAGIPKTLVKFMIEKYAEFEYSEMRETLLDIIDTPITPELAKNQKTEDLIGSYMLNDFIMHRFLTCGDDEKRIIFLLEKTFNLPNDESTKTVKHFFKRFYSQQFKRQALPDGPKILDVSLAPRSDFRMPSDVKRGI